MLNKKIRISYRTFLICFLLFPMLRCDPKSIEIWIGSQASVLIKNILSVWNMFSLVVISILFINKVLRHGIGFVKNYTWLAGALCFVFTVSTRIMSRGVGMQSIIREVGNIVAVCMLANVFSEKNYYYILRGFYYYLTFIMFLTAVTIYLLEPAYTNANGSAYYLFGLDNLSFLYSMNGFFAGMLYHLYRFGKPGKWFLLIYLFIGSAYIYTGTGTGTVIVVLCAVFLLIYRSRLLNILNYKIVLLLCGMIFIFLAFVQNLSIFSWLLDLIGKDTRMSGRSELWNAAFSEFSRYKYIGMGISASLLGEMLVSGGVEWGNSIGHMHNVIIEMLVKGGMINLIIYICMWLGCYKIVQHTKKGVLKNSIFCMILLQFLAYMFEYRLTDISFWILLLTLYNLPFLTNDLNSSDSGEDTWDIKKLFKIKKVFERNKNIGACYEEK